MKGKRLLAAMVVLAGAATVAWWQLDKSGDSLEWTLTLYGNIDIRQVQLRFHDPEHIAALFVQEGERVVKGQLLGVQDLERFEYALESAEARFEAQRQVVARLEAGSRPEEIRKARADVQEAEASVAFAEKELVRQRTLAARKLAPVEAEDRARTELDRARARLEGLQETLELAVIGPRREDIAEAKARLAETRTAVRLAGKILEDAHLVAPSAGIIQDRILEPGDMADAQTPVFTLPLTDPVWARVYVTATDLGKLSPGMAAEIQSDTFPDRRYPGWVGFISPTAEFTPKTVETPELRTALVYQVRVFACNPRNELRLGMPVTVSIALNGGRAPDPTTCLEAP